MVALLPSPAVRVTRLQQPWTWRLQSLLSAYLPLLLMAFLASGTWWLVKNTPMADAPTEAVAPRHEPDYRMNGFELQRFSPDGTLRVRLQGSEMRHYPDTDTLEIDGVEVRVFRPDGVTTRATALHALASGNGSEIQLTGEVHVRRVDAGGGVSLEMNGEFLHAFVNTEKLRSHLPMQIRTPGGEIQAQSFDFDNLSGKLSFSGRTAGRFAMPGGAPLAAAPAIRK